MSYTYSINSSVYYNNIEQCYKRIFVIDRMPLGPMQNIIRTLNTPKLSPFKQSSPCCPIKNCVMAIYHPDDVTQLLTIEQLPILITYLQNNSYTIDNTTTTLMFDNKQQISNNLIFLISY